MDCAIREWRMTDSVRLTKMLNNKKILDNLRDGLPYPYTAEAAKEYITSMLSADKTKTFAFAITVNDAVIGSIGAFAYNTASCRVLEKAGFELEGILRSNADKNNKVLDMKMYALVREER